MKGLRSRLPDAFAKFTSSTCQKIIAEVFEQDNKYWLEDEKLDENSEKELASQTVL